MLFVINELLGWLAGCLILFMLGGCETTSNPSTRGPGGLSTLPTAVASQHALVIGINRYQYADKANLCNLDGAVNDAQLLRDALRQLDVQLPDKRVLLDAQATRQAVIAAWHEMLQEANRGDTLIVTYSGHGGQQPDGEPLDESDGRDEMLMFHNFDPTQPTVGTLTDDELYGLMAQASDYNVVFLIDACHSGGMVRSFRSDCGRSRNGGFFLNAKRDSSFLFPSGLSRGDENSSLEHLTLMTAVNRDELVVTEVLLNNQPHGAFSWFFAKALSGKADGNHNGYLERNELSYFLEEQVSDFMNNQQKPKLSPRADNKSVIRLTDATTTVLPPDPLEVTIAVTNGEVVKGLTGARLVNASQTIDLRFVFNNGQIEVFNHTGDKLTVLINNTLEHWQALVNKKRLLKSLMAQFDMRLKPIRFILQEGDRLHKQGEVLHFSIEPGERSEGLNALISFNLAGNGDLQLVYPLPKMGDSPIVKQFPYLLPPMKIAPPFGGDDLVAILCHEPIANLQQLLVAKQPKIPSLDLIISELRNNTCQVGQYAFFSAK